MYLRNERFLVVILLGLECVSTNAFVGTIHVGRNWFAYDMDRTFSPAVWPVALQ